MKTRKILSLLLAVTMLLTAFSVAGLSVSAAEITAPGAGYVLSEETVVSSFVNGASTGGLASYNRTTVDANFPGLSTAPLFYGEFLTAADPAKSQDIFRYFSTSGDGMNGLPEDKSGLFISFWIRYKPVTGASNDAERTIRFMFYEREGGKSSGTYIQDEFTVVGNDEWQRVMLPIAEMENAEHFNGEGIHTFYLKTYYSAFAVNDYIAVADFQVKRGTWAPEKEETEKSLSSDSFELSYASDVTAAPTVFPVEKVDDFTINNETISGFRGTVINSSKFNVNRNVEVYYTFDEPVDLTENVDEAYLSFHLRLGGTLAATRTDTHPTTGAVFTTRLRVAMVTCLADGTQKNVYANVTLAQNGEWQKIVLNTNSTDLPYGGNKVADCALDNVVAIKFSIINGGTTNGYMYADTDDASGPDTMEIAGVQFAKVAEQPTTPAGIDLKFSEVSLSLSDNLTMNFKANKALFDSKYTNPYAMINGNKIAGVLDEENGVYVFSYDNIAPQSMADSITATLFATYNGSLCEGKTVESSVKTYCEWLLANATSDAQRRLVVDLYNYGSAAQAYVNKRPNRLINSYLSTTQAAWGTAEMANIANKTVNEDNGSAVTWSQAGLVLDDSVRVWFEFAAADTTGLTVKITDTTGKELDVIEAAAFAEQSAGVYRVSFDGLNAKGMRRLLNVTVYDAQGNAVSNTLTYSVESYIYTVLNGGSDNAKLQALVTALMNYGDAAIAYAAA